MLDFVGGNFACFPVLLVLSELCAMHTLPQSCCGMVAECVLMSSSCFVTPKTNMWSEACISLLGARNYNQAAV